MSDQWMEDLAEQVGSAAESEDVSDVDALALIRAKLDLPDDASNDYMLMWVDRWVNNDRTLLGTAATPQEQVTAEAAKEGVPRRGGAVEAWLKARRDRYDRDDSAEARALWNELDDALEDLRVRSDLGAPWSGRMVDHGDGREVHVDDDALFGGTS